MKNGKHSATTGPTESFPSLVLTISISTSSVKITEIRGRAQQSKAFLVNAVSIQIKHEIMFFGLIYGLLCEYSLLEVVK